MTFIQPSLNTLASVIAQTDNSSRVAEIAAIPPEGILSVAIVAAAAVVVILAYALRNYSTSGLSTAIKDLGDVLKLQMSFQNNIENGLTSLVLSISQIAEVLKDIQAMKGDIEQIKKSTSDDAEKSQNVLTSIEQRLSNIESGLDRLLKIATKEVKAVNVTQEVEIIKEDENEKE